MRRDAIALVLPTRRPPDAPPEAPPALPPGAEHVTPLTLEAVVRREPVGGRAQVVRQRISRTRDRIHVATRDDREWLFERNPRDERRVSGFLVEPSSRVIVVYDESDLRNMLGIRGWADALMLGFDPTLLENLKPTGETRRLGEIAFAHYAATGSEATVREAWWNSDQALPGAFVISDPGGVTRFSLERVRPGADPVLLRPLASRFPAYRVIDLADWLERH